MRLILNNHKKEALPRQVIIDFNQNICLLDHASTIDRASLFELDFVHPLLSEPPPEPNTCTHHYTYHNFQGLTQSGRFIYSTLLRSEHPTQCVFHIKPTSDYLKHKADYQIFFSMHPKKIAKKTISLAALHELSSFFCQNVFHYQDHLILDQTLTFKTLPNEINADYLYEEDLALIQFCERQDALEDYEIRYIHHMMGLGVFARKKIMQGEWIGIYSGLKKIPGKGLSRYTYRGGRDCFGLDTDAILYGNFTRFINHAESPERHDTPEPTLCYANLSAHVRYVNGQHLIIFMAARDIHIGEQLLVDYGVKYFSNVENQLFIRNDGRVVNVRGQPITDRFSQKRMILKIMAKHRIPGGYLCLVLRPIIGLIGISLLYLLAKFSL